MQPGPRTDSALEAVQPAAQLYETGRLAEALRSCREILKSDPDNVHALHLHGLVAYKCGELQPAMESLEKALRLGHSDEAMLNNLGEMYRGLGRLADAEACYRKALDLDPNYAEAGANLGVLLVASGRMEPSAENYLRLGLTLEKLRGRGEAEPVYRRALSLEPDSPKEHHELGLVLERLGRLEDAVARLQTALALDPAFFEACHNLGNILVRLERFEDAEQSYRSALALRPDSAITMFALSLVLLLRGDYAAGLPLYESRFTGSDRDNDTVRALIAKLSDVDAWKGESLAGKTLLVWTEQGFGDSLMGLRYLRLLKGRGVGRLLVYCEPGLVRLIQMMDCADEVISKADPVPLGSFERHCPLMSLPLLFDTRLETIPREVPYLRIPSALRQKWADRLAAVPPPRVGLVWAGGKMLRSDPVRSRSVGLKGLSPVVRISGASFVSLQKAEGAEQLKQSPWKIHDWMEECTDFLDTAALVEELDLVISVDTSVAHLAGALGKPVWMLNRFESEWRWQLDREDSPWYPTMRIFRQSAAGDWSAPVERSAAALREYVARRQPRFWLKRLFAS